MNDTQINHLIAARNKITDVMIHDAISTDTADIDALLREVPAGQRNDVDLLLGRSCAKLPARVEYDIEANRARIDAQRERLWNAAQVADRFVNPAVTLELDPVCAELLAQHNESVDQRKANGEGRRGGMTYLDKLEAAQRESKV